MSRNSRFRGLINTPQNGANCSTGTRRSVNLMKNGALTNFLFLTIASRVFHSLSSVILSVSSYFLPTSSRQNSFIIVHVQPDTHSTPSLFTRHFKCHNNSISILFLLKYFCWQVTQTQTTTSNWVELISLAYSSIHETKSNVKMRVSLIL